MSGIPDETLFMSVPAKKTPKRRTLQRRSHHGLKKAQLSVCDHCKAPAQPHRACVSCGYYAGKPLQTPEAAPKAHIKTAPKKTKTAAKATS